MYELTAEETAELEAIEKHVRENAEFSDQRPYGWVATMPDYDGPGSPIGSGSTKEAAINDLIEYIVTHD